MTELVFVDTTLFLYARDAGEPAKQPRAAAWLDRVWRDRTGRTSMQVLSEYYVNLTRKLSPGLPPEEAWDDVAALMAWRPATIDEPLMRRAREIEQRHRLSWWDSLVVAAAQVQGCTLLLTEDLQDGGVYGGVTVRSPFASTLSESAPPGVAAAGAGVRPRHRPKSTRGTP